MPESPTAQRAGTIQRRHQFVIDAAGEDLEHGVQDFRRGHAQAVDETALDAALGQEAGHLLAAAVDHHDLGTLPRAPPRSARQRSRDSADRAACRRV